MPANQPSQGYQDYVNALEVIAEVSDVVGSQLSEEVVRQAEGITRYAGVRMLGDVMRQAEALTYNSAPQRIVDQARYFTWKAVQEASMAAAGDARFVDQAYNDR